MLIDSISLKNFQCYYGDHEENTFNFKEGINLIIGNNGSGKSKLYDAFYWLLNDQIFDSSTRRLVNTSEYRHKIASDKAKSETYPMGTLSVEVVLTVTYKEDKKYKLSREMKILKVSDNEWENDNRSVLTINKFENYRWSPVMAAHHDSVINRIMPGEMKKYMWFQGEQVDGLLEFGKKDTFTTVINLLSDIKHFDRLKKLAEAGYKRATSDLTKAKAGQSKNANKSEAIQNDIVRLEAERDRHKNRLQEIKNNISDANEYIESLISELQEATEMQKKKEDLILNKSSLESSRKLIDSLYQSVNKNLFSKRWVLSGMSESFDLFSESIDSYFKRHNDRIAEVKKSDIKLPLNVPEPVHVKNMLLEEKCFVCGSDAPIGSLEYNNIKGLIERDENEEKTVFKNDCYTLFHRLYSSGLGLRGAVDDIDSSIRGFFESLKKHKFDANLANDAINDIENSYGELLADSTSENVLRSYRQHTKNKDGYLLEEKRLERELENAIKELAIKKKELDSLVVGNVDPIKIKAESLYEELCKITSKSREDIFSSLIKELEDTANKFFYEMTKDNAAITGKIALHQSAAGHFVPKILGSDDLELHSPNDSNIVLVKLALIMAIINSRGVLAETYTFVTDAPTSKMAKEYSHGFYNTLSRNFSQSIVTTYDFSDEKEWSILSEFNVGSAYLLTPVFDNKDRDDRTTLSVNIQEVI